MKKIFFFFFLVLITLSASAQKFQDALLYGKKENRILPLKLQGLPNDTFPIPTAPEDLRVYSWIAAKGDSVYMWNNNPSSYHWFLYATSSGAIAQTFQQTINAGNVTSKNDTIILGPRRFQFNVNEYNGSLLDSAVVKVYADDTAKTNLYAGRVAIYKTQTPAILYYAGNRDHTPGTTFKLGIGYDTTGQAALGGGGHGYTDLRDSAAVFVLESAGTPDFWQFTKYWTKGTGMTVMGYAGRGRVLIQGTGGPDFTNNGDAGLRKFNVYGDSYFNDSIHVNHVAYADTIQTPTLKGLYGMVTIDSFTQLQSRYRNNIGTNGYTFTVNENFDSTFNSQNKSGGINVIRTWETNHRHLHWDADYRAKQTFNISKNKTDTLGDCVSCSPYADYIGYKEIVGDSASKVSSSFAAYKPDVFDGRVEIRGLNSTGKVNAPNLDLYVFQGQGFVGPNVDSMGTTATFVDHGLSTTSFNHLNSHASFYSAVTSYSNTDTTFGLLQTGAGIWNRMQGNLKVVGDVYAPNLPSATTSKIIYWNSSDGKFSQGNPAMTGFSAGNWKTFYSNGSGVVSELSNGLSGQFLYSNGTTSAPSWHTPSYSDFSAPGNDRDVVFNNGGVLGTDPGNFTYSAGGVLSALNKVGAGQSFVSTGEFVISGASGSGTARITTGASISGTKWFVLPTTDGTNGYFLTSTGPNSTNVMTWTDPTAMTTLSSRLNNILNANGSATRDHTNNQIEWDWSTASDGYAFKMANTSTGSSLSNQKLMELASSGTNSNPNQTTFTLYVHNDKAGTGASNRAIYANVPTGGNNIAMFADGTGSAYGLYANSGTGNAVFGQSNGNAIYGVSLSGIAGYFQLNYSSTNTQETALRVHRSTTGTSASGIGAVQDWIIENGSGNDVTTAKFISKLTTVTNGAEVGNLEFWNINAGTLQKQFAILGTGQFLAPNYTSSSSFTLGAPVGTFVFDASGNVGTAAIGGGGGEANTASNLGGGLANFDSKSGVDLRFNSFNSSDFDLASNLISIDYTNGQASSGSTKGFLTSTDWTTFNNKISSTDRRVAFQSSVGTDANITAAAGTTYSLPAATLSTNRTIDMTNLNTNGDYIEIDNQEAGFTWSFTGQTVYDAWENSVTTLLTNTRYIIRRTNGKLKIIN